MGCGCKNRKKVNTNMETEVKSAVSTPTVSNGGEQTGKPRTGLRSYNDALGCGRCYAKHLAKALTQWEEYLEDNTRDAELALCFGNLGCAEDHAVALGREPDRRRIHDLRERIYENPAGVKDELFALAALAVRVSMQAAASERARRASAASSSGAETK